MSVHWIEDYDLCVYQELSKGVAVPGADKALPSQLRCEQLETEQSSHYHYAHTLHHLLPCHISASDDFAKGKTVSVTGHDRRLNPHL